MRDDDLRNFFDEDAYNELLAEYAERDQKKKTPEPDEPARAPHRSAAPQQETRRVERRAASERAAQRRAAETPAASERLCANTFSNPMALSLLRAL